MPTSGSPGGRGDEAAAGWSGSRTLRAGFLLAILFLAGFYTYFAFTDLNYLSVTGRLGSGFMPRIIGISLIAMCLLSLFADARGSTDEEALAPAWRSAAILALLSGIFVALLELAGGLLSMMIFMAVSLWYLNPRGHLQNALVAFGMPVATYVVFVVWLKATMPRGMLPLPF